MPAPDEAVVLTPASRGPGRQPLSHRAALAAALLVTILWSSSWVLIRWGLDGEALEPLTFAGLRYAVGAALLVAWLLLRRRDEARALRADRSLLGRLALLGVVSVAVAQGAQYVALDHQPAATTSLLLGLTPLLVAGAAAMSLGERPSPIQVGGAIMVAFGTALYAAGDLWATPVGLLAALIGLAATAVSSVLGRDVNRSARTSAAVVTAASMVVGAVLLLGVGLLLEGMPSLSARAWLLIGWLAAVNTAFAFTLWNRSLQRLTAVESAAINNTMLVQVALLAWLFLGEWPGLVGVAGILVVSMGVLLVQRRRTVSDVSTA